MNELNKYVVVVIGGTKYYFRVLRETSGYYVTNQFYSEGVVDTSSTFTKKNQVRWNKFTNARVGDSLLSPLIKMLRVTEEAPSDERLIV